MSIKEKIVELKERKGIYIVAHYYVDSVIQDVADFVGDSLELARKVRSIDADKIMFCGVYFMAETAKLLNPERKVMIPYYRAGCLLADMVIPEELEEFRREHPEFTAVAYVNSPASVKAIVDVCCTSANAIDVVNSIESDKVLFVPDGNLGEFVMENSSKQVVAWKGYCPVHHKLYADELKVVKLEYPDSVVAVHPECRKEVRDMADFIGSTSQIIGYAKGMKKKYMIVGTEVGIIHSLRKERPDVEFVPAYEGFICDQMKMITPERLLWAMERECFEVHVDGQVAARAKVSIERMFDIL